MQKTIKDTLSWSGIGLHSGVTSKVTLQPKNTGFGIKFQRTDIDKAPLIAADAKNVSSTIRGTNLKSGDTEIMTVEHLLSAIAAHGLDNVLIEVDGPEIPILDGSANAFYSDLQKIGFEEQDEEEQYVVINEVMEYKDPETGAEIIGLPFDGFSAEVWIDYADDMIGRQMATYEAENDFGTEIANARTFVLADDLNQLAQQDLIKGGDIDNAVVLMKEDFPESELKQVLEKLGKKDIDKKIAEIKKGPNFKYPNELARHKVLDLMGDLRLAGAKVKGRIIAKKPGHTVNVAFAKLLRTEFQKQRKLKGKPHYDPNLAPVLGVEQIKELLPHRYPFLMLDKIIELSDTHVVGVRNVTTNEEIFNGHFPGNPVFPGVLQMEALAQTGGILALQYADKAYKWDTYFLKMEGVKFKKMVFPGDTMVLKMELVGPVRRGIFQMQGTVYVGDSIVSEGELTAQIVKRES